MSAIRDRIAELARDLYIAEEHAVSWEDAWELDVERVNKVAMNLVLEGWSK